MPGPAAFVGDVYACPMQTPAVVPIPHAAGSVVMSPAMTMLDVGMPVVTLGAMGVCPGVPPVANIMLGDPTILYMGMPVGFLGAVTSHGGTISMGDPTYITL